MLSFLQEDFIFEEYSQFFACFFTEENKGARLSSTFITQKQSYNLHKDFMNIRIKKIVQATIFPSQRNFSRVDNIISITTIGCIKKVDKLISLASPKSLINKYVRKALWWIYRNEALVFFIKKHRGLSNFFCPIFLRLEKERKVLTFAKKVKEIASLVFVISKFCFSTPIGVCRLKKL